jgi:hypothetical protein
MRRPRHASTNKTQTPWLGATALHDLFQPRADHLAVQGVSHDLHTLSTATELIAGLVVAPPPQRSKPSSVTIEPIAAEQIKQSVEHLYRLGVRPVFEAFCAIHGGADVIDTLAPYHGLDPAVVAYLGADQLPRGWGKGQRYEN